MSRRSACKAALATINGLLSRQVAKGQLDEAGRAAILGADRRRQGARRARRLRSRHRGRFRERRGQAQDFRQPAAVPEAGSHRRLQHLLDFDHPARLRDRQSRALHRHSFHESGAAHAIGRADPRHRDQGRHVRGGQGVRAAARQDRDDVGGFSRLHRQPHPAADDQRGDLHALRGRRLGRIDRHRDAAGRQPSDGSAAARRFHRPRHLSCR